MTPVIDMRVIEIIFGIGLTIIAYFLKMIHGELKHVMERVNDFTTSIAIGNKRFEEFERRFSEIREERERRISALEAVVFKASKP